MTTKTDPRAEREALLRKARDIAATVEGAARDFTPEERTEVTDLINQAKTIGDNLKKAAESKRLISEVTELIKAEEAGELNEDALRGTSRGLQGLAKSVGRTFTDGEQYKKMLADAGGSFTEKSRIQSNPMPVKGGLKALVTSGNRDDEATASTLVTPQQLGLVPGMPYIAPKLRQIITTGTTGTDRIEYAQQIQIGAEGTTNAARAVAEATATGGTSGTKPESGLAFKKASADVITVAHWMPVTRRALSDAAQIRTMIDEFLRRGIDLELDRLILKGNEDAPVGDEEWNGILNTTGVQSQAFDTDLPRTIRKAISKVTNLGGVVNAVLVSPEVNEQLDLLQDENKRYLGAGPWGLAPNTIWGRPRIEVPALSAENKFILGDFTQCVLWDREQTTVTATDAHADFFIRNLVAILAEARAAFGIFNPSLLVAGADQAAG